MSWCLLEVSVTNLFLYRHQYLRTHPPPQLKLPRLLPPLLLDRSRRPSRLLLRRRLQPRRVLHPKRRPRRPHPLLLLLGKHPLLLLLGNPQPRRSLSSLPHRRQLPPRSFRSVLPLRELLSPPRSQRSSPQRRAQSEWPMAKFVYPVSMTTSTGSQLASATHLGCTSECISMQNFVPRKTTPRSARAAKSPLSRERIWTSTA